MLKYMIDIATRTSVVVEDIGLGVIVRSRFSHLVNHRPLGFIQYDHPYAIALRPLQTLKI